MKIDKLKYATFVLGVICLLSGILLNHWTDSIIGLLILIVVSAWDSSEKFSEIKKEIEDLKEKINKNL